MPDQTHSLLVRIPRPRKYFLAAVYMSAGEFLNGCVHSLPNH